MEQLVIKGGKKLKGEIKICGAKNSAVALIPATILCGGKSTISNLPQISDTSLLCDILSEMGADVNFKGSTMTINTAKISRGTDNELKAGKIRASYYLAGALLGRYKEAHIPLPGGCNLGTRPIDLHIKGFEKLGATVEISHGMLNLKAKKLVGTKIYLDIVSVGATINIMLAAVMAEGKTTIENAAKEPHIVDVANMLNKAGAKIKGAGTDKITIEGVKSLHGVKHKVIPDQIETGTYMIAAAATGGDVTIKDICLDDMASVIEKLREAGVVVDIIDKQTVRVTRKKQLQGISITTLPHPGFPTDLQSPMGTLLTMCNGVSKITESIWENRFKYTDELNKMGSDITVDGKVAVFKGVNKITGARVTAPDLRGGVALVIAGLIAEGTTIVSGVEHVNRGYEDIEGKLKSLGADINLEVVEE
ncbi:MAG: UDP-N-acetylglucosamine 1-carboxyvinyltransferase [Clostridia bacterium]|nr:UDP-N-acetylglucosamine 1-carboxyvinyltransferase [Clostridia bacterium]